MDLNPRRLTPGAERRPGLGRLGNYPDTEALDAVSLQAARSRLGQVTFA